MSRFFRAVPVIICVILASIYIYPIFTGLILLPLDLLVSHSNPWLYANTILLKNAYMQDSISQMFPWKHLTFMSLLSGTVPLWNPYQFMGIPFMAGMKSLVFYPTNILFLLGEQNAWNIHLWLQLFLSLWFSYLFAGSLGLKKLTSLFAAIAFAFSSLMVGVLEFGSEGHVLLWLPLLLYFVKRYGDTRKSIYIAGLATASAAALFAGQLQYFSYMCLVVVAFALFEGKGTMAQKGKSIIPIVLGLFLGSGIAAVQLIPGIEMFFQSYRGLGGGYNTFANGLLKPYSFLRLLSPDWFGHPLTHDLRGGYIESSGYFGILPLFFALYSLTVWKKSYVKFFACVGLFASLFSMDGFAQIFSFLHIPIVTSGYGGRLFSMALFSGAVLSAFGLEEFITEKDGKKKMIAVIGFVCIAAFCVVLGLVGNTWDAPYRLALSNIKMQGMVLVAFFGASIGYLLFFRKRKIAAVLICLAVIGLTYLDLFRMGYRFLTFSNPKFLYPELPVVSFVRSYTQSTLGRVYGITEPEIQSVFKVESPETYNPLYPIRTARLMQALENKTGTQLPENKYYLAQNERMKYVMDFLGVSVLVPGKGKNAAMEYWHSAALQNDLEKIYEDDTSDVYENKTAYPRFGLFYSVKTGVADDDALSAIREKQIDFTKTVLIKEPIMWNETEGTGSVSLTESGINTLAFRIETDKPAVLYLSDTFSPGWHAKIDGKETPILHANYNFRGVIVPTGVSSLTFWYLPMSVIIGGIVSGISALIAIAVFFAKRR